mgnify:FL=1
MKKWLIRNLGLKGSWSWAKKQMLNGKMVRCKHWTGALKLKIDNPENQLLQCCFWRDKRKVVEPFYNLWETSNHFLSYEDNTDYEVFEWPKE